MVAERRVEKKKAAIARPSPNAGKDWVDWAGSRKLRKRKISWYVILEEQKDSSPWLNFRF